jgi:uncharacterized repeat protein (TIGR04138 family)
MRDEQFITTVEKIITDDPRFAEEAYEFISDAVIYTTRKIEKKDNTKRHISGQELLEGIKDFAISQFGPLTQDVLESWGITDTISIGHIVFNMVDHKLLGSTEDDSIDDFKNGFDFTSAFTSPFLPAETKKTPTTIIDL